MQKISIIAEVQGKIFKTCLNQKNKYPGSDKRLALTLTLRLTLGLGLELTPGKTISVEDQVGVTSTIILFSSTQVLKIFP